jgi:hypothetical protein
MLFVWLYPTIPRWPIAEIRAPSAAILPIISATSPSLQISANAYLAGLNSAPVHGSEAILDSRVSLVFRPNVVEESLRNIHGPLILTPPIVSKEAQALLDSVSQHVMYGLLPIGGTSGSVIQRTH